MKALRGLSFVLVVGLWPLAASAQLNVLNSGGFAGPYRELLPVFEKDSGVTVTSTEAASQGNGPNTIPAILRRGVAADVVIISKEGLSELVGEGRVVAGTTVDLAQSPMGVAIRIGAPRPDITSVEGFKTAVLRARSINLVSTPAIYMKEKVFPALGIAEVVAGKVNTDNLAKLANSQVDLVLRPVSEVIKLPGFEFIGTFPREIQFFSVFTAAVVTGSQHVEAAKRLIAFLASEQAQPVMRKNGLEPIAALRK